MGAPETRLTSSFRGSLKLALGLDWIFKAEVFYKFSMVVWPGCASAQWGGICVEAPKGGYVCGKEPACA